VVVEKVPSREVLVLELEVLELEVSV